MIGPILSGLKPISYVTEKTYVACEGNSLTIGVGASPGLTYPQYLQALAPISDGLTIRNGGSSGRTISDMITYSGPVLADNFYQAGKTNVSIVWEGTNSIFQSGDTGGRTADEALAEMQQYCADRLNAHPDLKIVLMTTLPRMGGFWGQAVGNQYLLDFNDGIKSLYREFGAKMVVDVRQPGSPFAFTAFENSDFTTGAVNDLWAAGEITHIHLNTSGYAVIAQMVASGLRRLPAR